MKIEKALVTFIEDGHQKTLEFLDMQAKDIAHALIERAQPVLDVAIPGSLIERLKQEAKRDYMSSTKLFKDFEAYQELYVRLKISEYIRLEHAKQAYNEAVKAYENKISDIKERFNDLKESMSFSVNSDPEIIEAVNNLFTPIKD